MKLLEALALLVALGLFVWWQLRDLRIAKEQTKKQREREAAAATQAQESAADGTHDRTENHVTQQGGHQSSERAAPDTRPLR
ncbi:hypothetical protein [Rhodoferax sp.]|jgi:uncharacterized protein HemX|uniref:hypothetical protein n=1 Tax=Rhodoferax sp. TaxID=50421 RepID=UPI003783DA48